jgi:ABC-type sugar transport system ATPase subunit
MPDAAPDDAAPDPRPDRVPALEAVGIVKDFPGTRALDRVDLAVMAGEIHALLGENGAGKSTMIKCLCGAWPPTAGTIRLAGSAVAFADPRDAQAAGIAVVHQHGNLIPALSVEENLWLGTPLPRRAGILVDWGAVRAQARAWLAAVDLDIPPETVCAALRPDETAMVAIARAVASGARIIILDEPTAALLPHEVDTLFAQMRRLSARGQAFVYVSHRLSEVFAIADRVTVLRDGRNAGTFTRATLDRGAVIRAIVGRDKAAAGRTPAAGAGAAPLLAVEGLSGPRVQDATFTLHAGEVLGIAGLPGSGADETIDLLFGRHRAWAGTIRLDGRLLRLATPADAIAAGIALVPKDRLAEAVIPGASLRENITLPSLARFLRDPVARFVNRRAEDRAAREVMGRMRVRAPGIETAIEALSGGNQQKAVLGRWLTTGARVFLLNAPTAAVDVGAKAEIYDLIGTLAAGGAGVVFASPEVEEFPALCTRVLVFRDGRIAGELAGPALTEAAIMTLAAGGTPEHRPDHAPAHV